MSVIDFDGPRGLDATHGWRSPFVPDWVAYLRSRSTIAALYPLRARLAQDLRDSVDRWQATIGQPGHDDARADLDDDQFAHEAVEREIRRRQAINEARRAARYGSR